MKSFYLLTILSVLTSVMLPNVNADKHESFTGSWSMVTTTTEASNMEVCHRFVFSMRNDGETGTLSIELSLPNEPNNLDIYIAKIPFVYTEVAEEAGNENKLNINIQYSPFDFQHLNNNRHKQQVVPAAFINYMNEIKEKISREEQIYSLTKEGHNNLVVEGFSLFEESTYSHFKAGGSARSCNDLK